MGKKQVWTIDEVRGWFIERLPSDWFVEAPEIAADHEEIIVVGALADPAPPDAEDPDGSSRSGDVASRASISEFREDTRDARMRIADEAELLWGRKVSWGARCAGHEELFTTQSVPVMTRLRMPERAVLSTLIDAGVARNRSEALAWCVRLVGRNQADWIEQLREAMATVEAVRADGPEV